jgi:iron complex outermembrane receptor protein
VDIFRGSSGFAVENRHAGHQGAFKAFFNWGVHDVYDGFHSTDNNIGVLVYQAFQPLSNTTTTVGIDYKRYGGSARNSLGGVDFGRYFVQEYAGYILMQHTLMGVINLNGGVRANHGSIYGTEVVPQAGVAANVADGTTLKLSAGKGFRSPTIRELYLFPAPTTDLEPERLWNYEASLLRSFGAIASAELTVFHSEGTNLIRVEGAFPNLVLRNSGSFRHRGVEVAGTIKPDRQLSIDLAYSYLDPGEQTMANPRHKTFAGGAYLIEPVTVSLGAQYVAGLYGADFSRRRIGEYVALNARVTVQIAAFLSLYAAAENLLDRRYETMYGYPMPGTTVLAGVTYGAW